jgi:hypothetical protein
MKMMYRQDLIFSVEEEKKVDDDPEGKKARVLHQYSEAILF